MKLHTLASPAGDATYYSNGYRQLVESHYTYFLQNDQISLRSIDDQTADKYHGDFYGLLDALDYPKHHHWPILFFNRYRHSGDYRRETTVVLIPDVHYLDILMQLYKTRKSLI